MDGDFDSSTPHELTRSSAEDGASEVNAAAPGERPRRFSRGGDIFWTLAFLAGVGMLLWSVYGHREELLEDPEQYLERVTGRDLDAAEALERLPPWQRLLNTWDSSGLTNTLQDSIEAYQDFFDDDALSDSTSAPVTLAIFLAESGKPKDGENQLEQSSDAATLAMFKPLFEAAYLRGPLPPRSEANAALQEITPAWARDRVTIRLAQRRDEADVALAAETALLHRGRLLQTRISAMALVNLVLVASGLAALALWARQRRKDLSIAAGCPVAPWRFVDGYGVLVRGGVAGLLIAGGISTLADRAPFLTGFTTLLAGLPVLGLARRHLLGPDGVGFAATFGLQLPRGRWRELVGISLAILSLMLLGEALIGSLTSSWGESSLVESVPEEFLFDPWPRVFLSSADAIVWAPLIEELAFRGMLFASLRRRLPTVWAAVLSSVLFGIVHGYSLPGFVAIAWSGFLWALAYERSRSLLPGMLCHAMSNLLAVASPVLLYRL